MVRSGFRPPSWTQNLVSDRTLTTTYGSELPQAGPGFQAGLSCDLTTSSPYRYHSRMADQPGSEATPDPAERKTIAVLACPKCGAWVGPGGYAYIRLGEGESGFWRCLGCGIILLPTVPIGNSLPMLFDGSYRGKLDGLKRLYSDEGWGSRFAAEPVIACEVPAPDLGAIARGFAAVSPEW